MRGEGSNSQLQAQNSRVGKGRIQPANTEAAPDNKDDGERGATAAVARGLPGEGGGGRAQSGVMGRQRESGAEDEEEVTGESGGDASYAAGPPHTLGGVGVRAEYAMGLHHEYIRDEGADLQGFIPAQVYQLLVNMYGDHRHHNYETHLDRGMYNNAIWQRFWRRLANQSARWYSTPPGAVSRRFTVFLVAEWRGVCNRRCNYKRPLSLRKLS